MNARQKIGIGVIIGIFALILFLTMPPLFTPSDDEIKKKADNLPEVKTLHDRYNGTSQELDRYESISHSGSETIVQYLIDKYWRYSANTTIAEDTQVFRRLALNVQYDVLLGARIQNLICTGSVSSQSHGKPTLTYFLHPTLEEIRNTDCLENPGELPTEFLKH